MKISDINWLFNKYYGENPELKRIVWEHSFHVAKKALKINEIKNLKLDPMDVYVASMLHDIGVVNCNAPDIQARGVLPYLQHGLEGEKMLNENGLKKFARICVTHIGAGITAKEISSNNLPLPQKDFLPQTTLEKLICYCDKFFSKSHDLSREKTLEEVLAQMKKFGEGPFQRFLSLHRQFGLEVQ